MSGMVWKGVAGWERRVLVGYGEFLYGRVRQVWDGKVGLGAVGHG